jgi:hypothetical protein
LLLPLGCKCPHFRFSLMFDIWGAVFRELARFRLQSANAFALRVLTPSSLHPTRHARHIFPTSNAYRRVQLAELQSLRSEATHAIHVCRAGDRHALACTAVMKTSLRL